MNANRNSYFSKPDLRDRTRRFSSFYLIAVLLLMIYGPLVMVCYAQQDDAKDALMGGFEDMEDDAARATQDVLLEGFEDLGDADNLRQKEKAAGTQNNQSSAPKRSILNIDGQAKAAASYNFARKPPGRGLHRLKTEALIKADFKPIEAWQLHTSFKGSYDFVYMINGRDKYTRQIIDACEEELELRESYLQGSITPSLDLKVGRQVVIWGRSDNIRVADVINPMDLREPGITDIEDLRLPVTMTKLDYYRGPINLSGMLIHEVRVDRNPPYGSEFYPFDSPPIPEDIPPDTWENTQYAVSLTGIFSGWDFSLYWADLYSAVPYVELTYSDSEYLLEQKHARYDIWAGAANFTFGNWLFKAEGALLEGLKFTNRPDKDYDRLDLLLGLEYSGIRDTQLALEIANQHFLNYDDKLDNEPDQHDRNQLQWATRLTRNLMNERAAVTLLISVYGEMWQDGAFQRLSAEFDLTDRFTLNGGIVFYQSGDLVMFKNMEYNDRVFLELKYSF